MSLQSVLGSKVCVSRYFACNTDGPHITLVFEYWKNLPYANVLQVEQLQM